MVFLTGASGFVGREILADLVTRGFSVRALRHEREVPSDASEVVLGSLARISGLEPHLLGVEAVVHSAALLDPIDDEALAERINHLATAELAAAALRAKVRTFVYLSSQAAIGSASSTPGLVRPDATSAPTTVYGRSKLAAERALLALGPSPMRVVILRPPTVYGPGERRNFLALVRAIDTGWFVIPGSGNNRMSFCAVKNLSHAVGFCLVNDGARGILHVADEPALTFREIVELLAAALDRRILPFPLPLPVARTLARCFEVGFRFSKRQPPLSRARLRTLTADSALDTSETRRIGLEPVVSFAEALAETIGEYRSARLIRSR